MDNWLLIIVGVIFLIGIVIGYIRGLLRIGISLIATILTIVLVIFLSPYVGDAMSKWTPLDEMIEEKCMEVFMPEVNVEELKKKDLSATPLSVLDEDQLSDFNNLDWNRLGISIRDVVDVIGDIPKETQIKAIENAILPQFFKNLLLENNNSAIYQELEVRTFPEYVASYISRMLIKLLAFLVTFILVFILVRALMAAVDLIGELPVLGTLNHIGGAVAGGAAALLVVWILFLIMTAAYSTKAGQACFAMIDQSSILTFLYEKDILLTKLIAF